MPTYFTVTIEGKQFELISMHVKRPALFQVWTVVDGKRKRFHLGDSSGELKFSLPQDIPQDILELEEQLAYEAKVNWAL